MSTLKDNYLVKKRNILNEIKANSMNLQELRFFSIYLAKINPNDITTRVVRFSIVDFKAIMELGRINIDYMKKVTDSLLCKVVNVPNDRGGYTGFQLFKECTVDIDENNEWYVEIDAHDKALPLMFEYKNKYFSYHLYNNLRLGSTNQIHMYEVLKQYEKIGEKVFSIEKIKELLGIDEKEYPRYNDFKNRVLDACQQALEENTDIKFTYEPHGKRGKGGKILFLKFTIKKNTDYIDQLTLDMFIEKNKEDESMENKVLSVYDERINFLTGACNNEFSASEIIVLYNLMLEHLPYSIVDDELICYNYLKQKYDEMQMRDEKKKIKHRFAYLKSIITLE